MPANKPHFALPLHLQILRWLFPLLERFIPSLAKKLAIHFFYVPLKFKPSDKELAILASAEKYQFDVQGFECTGYYWLASGPLVVLVHGWAGRATQYYKLIKALNEANFAVASFDAVGHGNSEGTESSVVMFAEGIQKVMKRKGEAYALIGHSLGGVAAIMATLQNHNIQRLITISSPTIADDILKSFRKKINGSPLVAKWLTDKVRQEYQMEFEDYSATKLAENLKPLPFLIVHDTEDKEAELFHAEKLKEKAPFAKTFYTNGFGHTRILKCEEVIAEILSFLKKE